MGFNLLDSHIAAQAQGFAFKTAMAQKAGPALLKACKAALANLDKLSESRRKWTSDDQLTYDQLRRAIEKAEGR
jgi:hypothetical protein